MQIVIDISEENYKNIKEQVDKRDYPDMQIGRAIANGIPLPKGHGDLIDREELKKIIKENDALTMTGFSVRLCDIDNAKPIIEADTESEDKE